MKDRTKKMPMLFVGHGSPMNAIEDNEFTKNWETIGKQLPRPEAILAISAHWYTKGIKISDSIQPKMVYDMYGFPEELYQKDYPAKGAPEYAYLTKSLISSEVKLDNSWGYDHGIWSILLKMYPKADIPVYEFSIDSLIGAKDHYKIGQEISTLRDKGVLIMASGNVVHNLRRVDFDMEGGYPWAEEFDDYIKDKILKKQYQDVVHYEKAGESASLAFPTPEHFYPLLYILGASDDEDKISVFNDYCTMGALSMTSYIFK
jgi:4,5-DOPA dioxygenase extradiol